MSSVVVSLLFIFSIFMLFLLLSIIMFTIALLIFSPKGKAAGPNEADGRKPAGGDVRTGP